MANKRHWLISLLAALCIFALLLHCGEAKAAEVTIEWTYTADWPEGSDPEKSGFNLYHGLEGQPAIALDISRPMDARSYTYNEEEPGKHCYYVSVFNQAGESDKVNDCGYIVINKPDPADSLKVLIQELIAALQNYANRL